MNGYKTLKLLTVDQPFLTGNDSFDIFIFGVFIWLKMSFMVCEIMFSTFRNFYFLLISARTVNILALAKYQYGINI